MNHKKHGIIWTDIGLEEQLIKMKTEVDDQIQNRYNNNQTRVLEIYSSCSASELIDILCDKNNNGCIQLIVRSMHGSRLRQEQIIRHHR